MILTQRIKNLIKLFFREERKFYFFISKTAGYLPCNVDLFKEALTHKSAMRKIGDKMVYNERLEYLGDAILDMVVADILFEKYKDEDEGFLSKVRGTLVSRAVLNEISMEMGLSDNLRFNGSFPASHTHLPGDALEAFVAAIYLDKGLGRARKFIKKHIASDGQIENTVNGEVDYKSQLLQWGQKNKVEILFETKELSRTYDKYTNFVCIAKVGGVIRGEGQGVSKRKAEQKASCKVLESLVKCE